MYTGTLINDLMQTVERAEQRVHPMTDAAELERWYAVSHELTASEPSLVEVA
jgi:hypothetical protein